MVVVAGAVGRRPGPRVLFSPSCLSNAGVEDAGRSVYILMKSVGAQENNWVATWSVRRCSQIGWQVVRQAGGPSNTVKYQLGTA